MENNPKGSTQSIFGIKKVLEIKKRNKQGVEKRREQRKTKGEKRVKDQRGSKKPY
jgi:hypothetical protein